MKRNFIPVTDVTDVTLASGAQPSVTSVTSVTRASDETRFRLCQRSLRVLPKPFFPKLVTGAFKESAQL